MDFSCINFKGLFINNIIYVVDISVDISPNQVDILLETKK